MFGIPVYSRAFSFNFPSLRIRPQSALKNCWGSKHTLLSRHGATHSFDTQSRNETVDFQGTMQKYCLSYMYCVLCQVRYTIIYLKYSSGVFVSSTTHRATGTQQIHC